MSFQNTCTLPVLQVSICMLSGLQGMVGNANQVAQLLDTLLMGGTDTMDKFIYALRASYHSESVIKELLRDPIQSDTWQSDLSANAGELS